RDSSGDVVVKSETALCILTPGDLATSTRRLPAGAASPIPDLRLDAITWSEVQRYAAASLDDNPLHHDIDVARSLGFDRPIVHGMLVLGQFERALVAWRRDLRVTRLFGAFLQPLLMDSGIVISSRVALRRPSSDGGEELVVRLGARTDQDAGIC